MATTVEAHRRRGWSQARSQRGRIGDTWWSQRFIAVLESFGIGSRLQRGKRYARTGQVLSMDVAAGQVKASVQGSRAKPYRVFIETGVLTAPNGTLPKPSWRRARSSLPGCWPTTCPRRSRKRCRDRRPRCSRRSPTISTSACSCPDWENPCKHIAAVYYLLAEAFDADPFLIFAWRGRAKDELLAGLRARRRRSDPDNGNPSSAAPRSGATGPFGWPAADAEHTTSGKDANSTFTWGTDADLAPIPTRPRLAVAPDLILRQLDPAPLGPDQGRIAEDLRALYEVITAGAAAVAGDEESEG